MESAPLPQKKAKWQSTVADLIKFEPLEDPPWRKNESLPSVPEMLKEIAQFMQNRNSRDTKNVDGEYFVNKFIFHCNFEEGHGLGTIEDTERYFRQVHSRLRKRRMLPVKQQETVNLKEAYKHLLKFKEDEPDSRNHGLIEESMLREVHKIILKDVPESTSGKSTKPGVYSSKPRITSWKGELYKYQMPEDMLNAVNEILYKFNSLYEDSQTETDEEKRLEKLFKACSWFMFEMLDLHPFANGNGRLCRLLCSYVLSTVNPFPTPIYNVWTESSKDDYEQALVDARESEERHPRALLTMIVECSWSGWKQYLQKLKSGTEAGSSHVSQDGSSVASSS